MDESNTNMHKDNQARRMSIEESVVQWFGEYCEIAAVMIDAVLS
jgi:hypothetical protein